MHSCQNIQNKNKKKLRIKTTTKFFFFNNDDKYVQLRV